MDSFPAPHEWLQAIGYPPVFVAALIGGLVTRRWFVAASLGFILAPAADMALAAAFSDSQPTFYWRTSLTFGSVAAILALVLWGIAWTFRARRRMRSGSAAD